MVENKEIQKKLGELANYLGKWTKADIGELKDLYDDNLEIVAVSVTYQDKNGSQMRQEFKHKDFEEDDGVVK